MSDFVSSWQEPQIAPALATQTITCRHHAAEVMVASKKKCHSHLITPLCDVQKKHILSVSLDSPTDNQRKIMDMLQIAAFCLTPQ